MEALKCIDLGKFFFKARNSKNGNAREGRTGILKNLNFFKKERFRALSDINFTVKKGEIFGIIGPNGSGKSTLIRIISTLLLPDEGCAGIFGLDVVREPLNVRKFLNRVSVDAAFFKKLSAMENLIYAARLYGVGGKEAVERAGDILERLGFDRSRMREPLEDMSRGMQQKVAVARALLTSPILLLLDEPTTGLDPKSKRQVQEFVSEIRETHDATILLTSHDMDEVERVCDRIAVINRGTFVDINTADGLKKRLKNGGNLEDVFMELTDEEC